MLFRVVLAVAILVIYVYGLVDVIRTDRRLTRGISKPAWLIVVTVLPVIGAILWLLIGRPRGSAPVRQAQRQPSSPDDDPDFLRNLEMRRRNQAEAARLRKLKDDLEAKTKADGGSTGTGQDSTGKRGAAGMGHSEAGDASTGDADTHDTGDVK